MESPPLPISASPTAHAPSLESPTRPPLTADSTSSHFADSGLGASTLRTPSPRHKRSPRHIITSPSKTTTISSRLSQLAALASESEENLDEHTCASVQSQLHAIEAQLEGRTRGNEQTSSDVDLSISNSGSPNASSASSILEPAGHVSQGTSTKRSPSPATESIPYLDLTPILTHLTATLTNIRTRLSESKHLHSLTMSKLSSISQSNVNLTAQLSQSRQTNTSLSHANAALRMRVDDLETTTTQQAVAVSAMTGAVAGLESYVRSSSPYPPSTPRNQHFYMNGQQHTPNANSGARRQTVIRGSGRFRGKYPVSSAQLERRDSTDMNLNLDGPSERRQTELQEGILAWVRGFRDVEAGWREMDTIHRTPTRFGNEHADMLQPQTPTRQPPDEIGTEPERAQSRARSEEESVLLQGDKVGGSDADIFGQDDDFGDFVTSNSNG